MRKPFVVKKTSHLEALFIQLWAECGGGELVREHYFHPIRRWRADFASVEKRVLIEVEGGIWNGGRHGRGSGFSKDAEKYLTATLDGWTVIRLTSAQLTLEIIQKIVEYVENRG